MKNQGSVIISVFTLFMVLLAFNSFSQKANVGSQCLVAAYSFSGNAQDATSNGFDGTVVGASLTSDCSGNSKSAYSFDGVDDYITLNKNSPIITSTEFSVHIKAKILGKGGGEKGTLALFAQRDDRTTPGESIISFFAQNRYGDIALTVRGSSNSTGDKLYYPTPTDGDWHCYTATYGADDTIRMYLDGIEVAKTKSTQSGDFKTSIDYVEIGRHSYKGGTKGLFNGVIDEVMVYDCAIVPNTKCCDISTSISNPGTLSSKKVSVFPNPTIGECVITSPAKVKFELYSGTGQLVKTGILNQGETVIDISGLHNGIYRLRANGQSLGVIKE